MYGQSTLCPTHHMHRSDSAKVTPRVVVHVHVVQGERLNMWGLPSPQEP